MVQKTVRYVYLSDRSAVVLWTQATEEACSLSALQVQGRVLDSPLLSALTCLCSPQCACQGFSTATATAAWKSAALQHLCPGLVTGNDRRRAREHRGTPLGCFNSTLMTRLPVSSKCWGSSSLLSLSLRASPVHSTMLPIVWICSGSSVPTARKKKQISNSNGNSSRAMEPWSQIMAL